MALWSPRVAFRQSSLIVAFLFFSLPQNEDIDIALDDCTGVAFAELVNAYLLSQGHEAGKVAVIEVRMRSPATNRRKARGRKACGDIVKVSILARCRIQRRVLASSDILPT